MVLWEEGNTAPDGGNTGPIGEGQYGLWEEDNMAPSDEEGTTVR